MIFVTIGSMFPFDRLIRAMDAWAEAQGPAHGSGRDGPEILAQIGRGGYEPKHMRWVRLLGRDDYTSVVTQADLVVAHAGMGSVITAGEHGKPIVVLPRRAAQGEHTNDHQVDTAGWLRTRPGVYVADAEQELAARVAEALAGKAGRTVEACAPAAFLARIRAFAQG
ncbi:MAG TPA: glycosyltransferase [Thermoleophilaceae bacterium]|nr:glycosyltransferase [Thermoleophilaceae bacterium]